MNILSIYRNLLSKVILVMSLLLFIGCRAQTQTHITGTISPDPEWNQVVYLIVPRSYQEIASNFLGQVVDSATISKDGAFELAYTSLHADRTLVQLVLQKKGSRYANMLMDEVPGDANYIPLVLEAGRNISIKASSNAFQASIRITDPTPENKALMQLRDLRLEAYNTKMKDAKQTEGVDSLLMEHERAQRQYQRTLLEFADMHATDMAALVAVRWASPDGDLERIPEFIDRLCHKWNFGKKADPFKQQLCDLASADNLPVLVGDVIPDFPMPLPTGDTFNLHSLLGKSITILDIWASWCAPCRRENRDVLAPLYAQHKSNGLEIIAYSIDNGGPAWKTAIEKDGAVWQHTSHLTGDSTPFMDALRITTIPANFILDENGKVIAKNLHGEVLSTFVQDYLNSK